LFSHGEPLRLEKRREKGFFTRAAKSSEHRNVAEQQSTIAAKTTVAQEQKQIEALTTTVQKVSERVELRAPARLAGALHQQIFSETETEVCLLAQVIC
jgi:hypothetical protein